MAGLVLKSGDYRLLEAVVSDTIVEEADVVYVYRGKYFIYDDTAETTVYFKEVPLVGIKVTLTDDDSEIHFSPG